MTHRAIPGHALIAGLLLSLGPGAGFAAENVPTVVMDEELYAGLEASFFVDEIQPEDGPPRTLELSDGERVILPSQVTEDDIVNMTRVQGLGPELDDAFVVGIIVRWNVIPEAYALIYGGQPGQRQLKIQIPMRNYYDQAQTVQLGEERALLLRGVSGMHFDDVWVYRFPEGRPELLLAKGSAAGVEFKTDAATGAAQVWVGIENWDDPTWNYATGTRLWNVYRWDGVNFVFDTDLSTIREVSAEERLGGFVNAVHKAMDKPGDESE